jgi:CRP/FNR family transcriptional regulator
MSIPAERIISQCELFGQVDTQRCRRLAEVSVMRKFGKGEQIFRQGDECPGVYIVVTGTVRIFKTGPSGKEHVLHLISPGNTFAEVAAIGGFPCPAHAEAVAKSSCLLIPFDRFRREILDDQQLCLEMMTGMAVWVRKLITLMEDLVLRDALGRTSRFLLESAVDRDGYVVLPGLKRHVASHLNLTSETFSRTLGRLIEAGLLVEMENQRVELKDREKLKAISEGKFPTI